MSQIVTVLDAKSSPIASTRKAGRYWCRKMTVENAHDPCRQRRAGDLAQRYELMDKDEVLGSSQFVQNVPTNAASKGNWRRALCRWMRWERAGASGAQRRKLVCGQRCAQNSASVVVRLHYGAKLNMDR